MLRVVCIFISARPLGRVLFMRFFYSEKVYSRMNETGRLFGRFMHSGKKGALRVTKKNFSPNGLRGNAEKETVNFPLVKLCGVV